VASELQIPAGTTPRQVIENLREDPWNSQYDYDEFVKVLKTRLHRFTGKDEVMFYNEEKIVQLLVQLKEISFIEE
jgi:hypothetical protein